MWVRSRDFISCLIIYWHVLILLRALGVYNFRDYLLLCGSYVVHIGTEVKAFFIADINHHSNITTIPCLVSIFFLDKIIFIILNCFYAAYKFAVDSIINIIEQ